MSIVRVGEDKIKVKLSTTIWNYVVAIGLCFAFVIYKFSDHTIQVNWRGASPTFLSWQEKAWSTFFAWTQLSTATAIIMFGITYCLLWREIKELNTRCRQSVCYALTFHALSMMGWLIAVLTNFVVAVSH